MMLIPSGVPYKPPQVYPKVYFPGNPAKDSMIAKLRFWSWITLQLAVNVDPVISDRWSDNTT